MKYCPFNIVARCQQNECMAWEDDRCLLIHKDCNKGWKSIPRLVPLECSVRMPNQAVSGVDE